MELQRATKEGVLELDRISAKIGSTVNAVWGTIEGDITKQTDLQDELKKVKDSIPTKVPADGGNADTVNGHTVECDVPANAKFTDTVYDDSTINCLPFISIGSLFFIILANSGSFIVIYFPLSVLI